MIVLTNTETVSDAVRHAIETAAVYGVALPDPPKLPEWITAAAATADPVQIIAQIQWKVAVSKYGGGGVLGSVRDSHCLVCVGV